MKYPYMFDLILKGFELTCDEEDLQTEHLKEYALSENELISTLNDKQLKLFKDFKYDLIMHMFEIRDEEVCKVMFESFKIYNEFQEYFNNKFL